MMTFDEWHSAQMHGEDKPCPYEEHERFSWHACMLELHKVIAWDRQYGDPTMHMTKDRLERIKVDWYASVERRDHIRELWLALEQSWVELYEAKKKLELKEIELP